MQTEANTGNQPTEPGRESLLAQPNEELLDAIRAKHEKVKELKDKRSAINQQISAVYTELEGLGVEKKAAKAVFALYELEEDDQRRMYDLSASVVRKALRMPLQGELFGEAQVEI